jgi:hypothetical protein
MPWQERLLVTVVTPNVIKNLTRGLYIPVIASGLSMFTCRLKVLTNVIADLWFVIVYRPFMNAGPVVAS